MSEADPQADVETPGPSPFAEQLRVSSPFAEQFRVPQFGIIHLLIWSTVTAVLLKYYLAIADESSFQESPVQLWLIRISQSLSAILVGSIVIGSGILIRARCYKMLRRLQPGHWLVLVVTFGAAQPDCVANLPALLARVRRRFGATFSARRLPAA